MLVLGFAIGAKIGKRSFGERSWEVNLYKGFFSAYEFAQPAARLGSYIFISAMNEDWQYEVGILKGRG